MDLENKGPSVEDEVKNFLKDFKVDDNDDLDLLLGLEEFKGEFSNLQGQGTRSDLGEEQNNFAMELEQQMEEESPILALNEENNFAMELEWEIEEESVASKEQAMSDAFADNAANRPSDGSIDRSLALEKSREMIWAGFAYAADAVIGHNCIDASRRPSASRTASSSSGFYELCDHKRAPELAGAHGNRGHLAPSLLNFAALQRGFTAVPVVLYLLVTSKVVLAFDSVLLAVSLFEAVAFICYLKSLEILLVSYAVAEKIWRRYKIENKNALHDF
ncbi:hypothetical protein SELMODRAFT_413050 [Selaginella moellendorffii]|uniref:Uncharacterized protein n=1 Tax=Selaginella moellendorffii TaxID=88036 RepID=D8RN66_SELML|nr:hypothetical protein SELMODRAFT_413050 [Selaginella moellendorffii]